MATTFSGKDRTDTSRLLGPRYALLGPTDAGQALEGGVVINPAGFTADLRI
jgi:hypothetical protein